MTVPWYEGNPEGYQLLQASVGEGRATTVLFTRDNRAVIEEWTWSEFDRNWRTSIHHSAMVTLTPFMIKKLHSLYVERLEAK